MPSRFLEGLNPAQAEAVQAVDGPVLVLAGPGSGKTRVLTHRIAHLIADHGVRPYQIMAVTFTNKAAREMVERLHDLIGAEAGELTVGTFHAVCARILRREADALGISPSFSIYDEDDQRRLMTRALAEEDLDPRSYAPAAMLGGVSRAKNELIAPEAFAPRTHREEAVRRAYVTYERLKAEASALDFDDLLLLAERLLREHPNVLERYRRRYRHILVDEFQDTNKAQYALLQHLAGERGNLFVVGDEDQSIYSWRGADFRNVLRFSGSYPQARTFYLEQNYRSTGTVLQAARAVISRNAERMDKALWTENRAGGPIRLFEAYDAAEEAEYVAKEIALLVARDACRYGQCAVMFRTNAQSRVLEDALLRHGLPYRLVGGIRFYQRREVKDLIAYLRLVFNPDDEISLLRVINLPARGIGSKTIADLRRLAADLELSPGCALLQLAAGHPPDADHLSARAANLLAEFGTLLAGLRERMASGTLAELLQAVFERTGYLRALHEEGPGSEERVASAQELLSAAEEYSLVPTETALPAFLERAALAADTDELPDGGGAVTLQTLHTAKGLEYDVVFIIGLEEGLCPHARNADTAGGMEEERRLLYVGITRTRRRLYLLYAFRRTIFGSDEPRVPSRFLRDIPPQLIEWVREPRANGAYAQRVAPSSGRTLDERARRRALLTERRQRVRQAVARRAELQEPEPPSHRREPRAAEPRVEPNYRPGDAVAHPSFGSGVVVASEMRGGDEEVTVAFEGRGIKRLLASMANLERR